MALYTIRSGITNHPETSVLQSISDMVRTGGLVNPSSDFLVGEASGGGLNVSVGIGNAYVKGANTNAYPVRLTTTYNQEISPNTSGNPRIDAIVLYIDLSATPNPSGAGEGVALITAVEGIPASSPVAPTESAIQAIVGASNPYLRLANVTVANNASGISEANIVNIKRRVFIQTYAPIYEEAFDATWTPNFVNSNKQKMRLTGNVTVSAPENMEIGDLIQIEFLQDASGGRSVTWFSGITWLSADYSLNTDPNSISVFIFEKTGNSTFKGYLAGKEY
jgi:hypothetical protein